MLIERTKSSPFCCATFSKALVGSRLHAGGHRASLPFPWAHPPFRAATRAEDQAQPARRLTACPALPASCPPRPTLGSGLGPSGALWTGCFLTAEASRIHTFQSCISKADPDIFSWHPSIARRRGQGGAKPACQPWSFVHPNYQHGSSSATHSANGCLPSRERLHRHWAVPPAERLSLLPKQSSGTTAREQEDSAEAGPQHLHCLVFPCLILKALASSAVVSKATSPWTGSHR